MALASAMTPAQSMAKTAAASAEHALVLLSRAPEAVSNVVIPELHHHSIAASSQGAAYPGLQKSMGFAEQVPGREPRSSVVE